MPPERGAVVTGPAKETICAIIVTFHPDRDLPDRVERIASQVRRVVIVDNHSDQATISVLRGLSARLSVHLILNDENLGVATALNQGMAEAIRQGFAWALLFDQDTLASEPMVTTLIKVYGEYPEKNKLAILGSNYLDPSTREAPLALPADTGASWVERKAVITSGSLISIPVFQAVGRFRDEFFIDDVDHEYCLRARARGFKVILAREPVMVHGVGVAEKRRFLWRTVRPSNHSAVRWYYMTRNAVVLAQEYWRKESTWVLGNLYHRLKWMIKAVLYEHDRQSKVRRMLQGGLHGLQGKLGKF